jgi:hypothetical protein
LQALIAQRRFFLPHRHRLRNWKQSPSRPGPD